MRRERRRGVGIGRKGSRKREGKAGVNEMEGERPREGKWEAGRQGGREEGTGGESKSRVRFGREGGADRLTECMCNAALLLASHMHARARLTILCTLQPRPPLIMTLAVPLLLTSATNFE